MRIHFAILFDQHRNKCNRYHVTKEKVPNLIILQLGKILAYQNHADKVPGLFNAKIRKNFQDFKEVLQMSQTEERDIPCSCKSPPRKVDDGVTLRSSSSRSDSRTAGIRIWNIGPIGGDPWMLQSDQRELALALLTIGYDRMIERGYKTPKFKEMMQREHYHIKAFRERKANTTPRKNDKSLHPGVFKSPPPPPPLPLQSSFSMPTPSSSAGLLFGTEDSGNSSSEGDVSRYFSDETDRMYRNTAVHEVYRALENLQNSSHYILEDDTKTNGQFLRFQFDTHKHMKTVHKRNRLIAIHNVIVSIAKSLGLPSKKTESVFFKYMPTDSNVLKTIPSKSNSKWYWAPPVSKRTREQSLSQKLDEKKFQIQTFPTTLTSSPIRHRQFLVVVVVVTAHHPATVRDHPLRLDFKIKYIDRHIVVIN